MASTKPTVSTSGGGGVSAARKEENEYIPSFISKTPFYLGDLESSEDSLQHQRAPRTALEQGSVLWTEIRKPKKTGPAATKYRKGACENCGAMGHSRKSCLERPRKVGARFTGRDIQADREVAPEFSVDGNDAAKGGAGGMGWDAKRDAYHGYDPQQYKEVVEEYEMKEEARRAAQAALAASNKENGEDLEGEEDEEEKGDYEKGFKYAEESEMGRDKSIKQSIRIREDTAKYLLNLDPESAKYNPKKRALVDPGAVSDKSAALFAEENFLRGSGEASEFEKAQRYAWEKQEMTGDTSLHLQANPTAGAFLQKIEAEERERKRQKRAEILASQYGEQPKMPEAIKELAGATKEEFVEYDEAGLIKGAPGRSTKSKYAEDVFPGNHTSIWGSWWSDFKWGYACCRSFVKNSYCTGEAGKQVQKGST